MTAEQARQAFALPPSWGNTLDYVSVFTTSRDVIIANGGFSRAVKQEDDISGRVYVGGGTEVQIRPSDYGRLIPIQRTQGPPE
jgi:hypothetical protein